MTNQPIEKEIDELTENYGGNALIGEYRHVYNCPDRDLAEPSCPCLTPEQYKQALIELVAKVRVDELQRVEVYQDDKATTQYIRNRLKELSKEKTNV